jgi:Transglutaminase-like superfamily
MQKFAGLLCGWFLVVLPAYGEEPRGQVVEETWQSAKLDGTHAGYAHTIVREIARDGKKVWQTTVELRLALNRGQPIQLRMETGSEETPEGKVTAVTMRQFQGRQLLLDMRGTVRDDELEVVVKSQQMVTRKTLSWDDRVLGLYGQEKIFQERKVKPGDTFSFKTFEPMISNFVTNRVTVKNYEEVGTRKGKQRLLRIEEVPDKVVADNGTVQLPPLIAWLDKDRRVVRSESEMPVLGKLVLERGSQREATASAGAAARDILVSASIPLNQRIPRPNETRSAVYRITVKGDDDAASTFVGDERQTSANVAGDTFELHVRASSGPTAVARPGKAKDVYLKSCHFINSDDPEVQRLSRSAVGRESDPWTRARKIERWVHDHMTVSFSEDLCPAGNVARNLRGDCRQHSMLTAALCRAAGIPSRTAVGLVYAEDPKPVMAFHMWTEVFVDGQWLAIDATRGQGHVGATHLKITDSSWHDEVSLTPLLPVLRVVGKLTIKVLRVDDEG